MHLTHISSEPLHHQIFRQIRGLILSGALAAGEELASIRAFALQQKVSVITVQRAYDDLDRAGLILTRRGKPSIVANISLNKRKKMVLSRLREQLGPLLSQAKLDGLNEEELHSEITAFVHEVFSHKTGETS